MSINASLIGQIITFAIFVWFCMKFIWPKLMAAIKERQKGIADGLAAADRGQRELESAEFKVLEMIDEAKQQAAEILEGAQQRAHHIVEDAKNKARGEYDKIVAQAHDEIEQATNTAKRELYDQVSHLILDGTEKVLARNIDKSDNDRFIEQLIAEAK
jgi:F-type H+-transporting ATPase subunit b